MKTLKTFAAPFALVAATLAVAMPAQARDIQRLYASYARGGLTRGEVANLQTRVNRVRVALRMERRDWDNRRG